MTTQPPLISVIIPVFNRRHLVIRSLQSVFNQSYKNYELIVIDDASSDGTADWIEAQHLQIQLIRLTQNMGAAEARNVGIRAAKGKLIAFLDSDDYWKNTYLETMVRALQQEPQASFVFANHHQILQNGTVQQFVYKTSNQYRDLIHRCLADTFIYTMSAVMVQKWALETGRLLDTRLSSCHDRELYIRLLQEGEMAHVRDFLVTRVMHDKNISANYRNWANNIFMTLDIFFKNPKNKNYLPLEPAIRRTWAMIIAKYMWKVENAPLFSVLMLFRAFQAEPNLMFRKLWKKLIRTPIKNSYRTNS